MRKIGQMKTIYTISLFSVSFSLVVSRQNDRQFRKNGLYTFPHNAFFRKLTQQFDNGKHSKIQMISRTILHLICDCAWNPEVIRRMHFRARNIREWGVRSKKTRTIHGIHYECLNFYIIILAGRETYILQEAVVFQTWVKLVFKKILIGYLPTGPKNRFRYVGRKQVYS